MLCRFVGNTLIVACAWTGLCGSLVGQSPSADSSITFTHSPGVQLSHEPVKLEGLVWDGRPLPLESSLRLSADWPSHLSIRLRNVSLRPITYIMLNLSFPESETTSTPPFGHQVHLGNLVPVRAKTRSGELVNREQLTSLDWLPGTEVTIPLLTISDTLAAADRVHKPITRIVVYPPRVQFQDVSLWDGSYHHCQSDGSHCVDASYSDFLPH